MGRQTRKASNLSTAAVVLTERIVRQSSNRAASHDEDKKRWCPSAG